MNDGLRAHAGRFCALLALGLASACSGEAGDATNGGAGSGNGASSSGGASGTGSGTAAMGGADPSSGWRPVEACDPVLPAKVSRLTDRHYANAVRDLLGLSTTPAFETNADSPEMFLSNKPAAVTASVALSMRDVAETYSAEATATGKPSVQCTGDEQACARAFIDRFATRAFRRPISDAERTALLTVYTSGRDNYGAHAGGIRLVIEAVVQSPSFLYLSELGEGTAARRDLSSYELATKISLFLRDSLPDDQLWQAVLDGRFESDADIAAEVTRLLASDGVKANITQIFSRFFDIDRVRQISKSPEITEFTPALAASMYEGTRRFIQATLWERGASLSELLGSREVFVDAALAPLYGVTAPVANGFGVVTAPASERAGILTEPSLMATYALPNESSVVHRGVFLIRQLLCFQPGAPQATFLQQGEALKMVEPTERGRADRRRAIATCAGCHATFDPLGIAFENYDTLGRYRTAIDTPSGPVPVDASWDFDLYDIQGHVDGAVDLAERLAQSAAVRECMSQQIASYAYGQRLNEAQRCTVGQMSRDLAQTNGNLLDVVERVATWPGLRSRIAETAP